MNFDPLFRAFVYYFVFLGFLVLLRVGKKSAPLQYISYAHLVIAPFYYLIELILYRTNFNEALVGLYAFFAFHYPFGFIVLGQVSRGFSLNLCVAAHNAGGKISLADLKRFFGGGRGVDALMEDRKKVMLAAGMAKANANGGLTLTPAGKFVVRANCVFLRLFGLNYLGKS